MDDPKSDEGFIIIARATYRRSKTWAALTYEQKALMFLLLMMANHKDQDFWDELQQKHIAIKRGQLVTSVDKLQTHLGRGATPKKIRTALAKLKKLDFLAIQTTSRYSLVTLVNYDFYQTADNYRANQMANQGQDDGKPRATNKNEKNAKNEEKVNSITEFVAWFNQEFGTNYRAKTYLEKIRARFKGFTVDQLKQAALTMKMDSHMMGNNDGGRVYATLEYLSRNDANVDKWLNSKSGTMQKITAGRHHIKLTDEEFRDSYKNW
jgi:hypothetical protein